MLFPESLPFLLAAAALSPSARPRMPRPLFKAGPTTLFVQAGGLCVCICESCLPVPRDG